jgi:hypothetical protein
MVGHFHWPHDVQTAVYQFLGGHGCTVAANVLDHPFDPS